MINDKVCFIKTTEKTCNFSNTCKKSQQNDKTLSSSLTLFILASNLSIGWSRNGFDGSHKASVTSKLK